MFFLARRAPPCAWSFQVRCKWAGMKAQLIFVRPLRRLMTWPNFGSMGANLCRPTQTSRIPNRGSAPARRQTSRNDVGRGFQMLAVYVDDFLLAAVEDREGKLIEKAAGATLHAIHSVFPPPTAGDERPDLRKETEERGRAVGPYKRDPRVRA
jgi:hypothetical protein